MRMIGIDPGLLTSGYGVVEGFRDIRLLEAGIIRTGPGSALEKRLDTLYKALEGIMEEYRPKIMVVEDLYTNYRHPRTAVLMGHARGVIFLAAARQNIPVVGYAPTKVKKALTGNGQAGKEQMQRMIQSALRLPEVPKPDHVADALAMALCHINTLNRNLFECPGETNIKSI